MRVESRPFERGERVRTTVAAPELPAGTQGTVRDIYRHQGEREWDVMVEFPEGLFSVMCSSESPVMEACRGGRAMSGPRVFWPGDEIPAGTVVMGSDHQPWSSRWVSRVDPGQLRPLVEVQLPDYMAVVTEAAERDGVELGEHPASGRWGVLSRREEATR